MLQTLPELTFEDYLNYDDKTETRYELVNGQLIEMTPPTLQHILIVRFLLLTFEAEIKRLKQPWLTLVGAGQRTGLRSSRIPDLMIVHKQEVEALKFRPAVFEKPALLAVEVVSPSSVEDDYIHKRDEYQAMGITEYWIVDAISNQPKITIHDLGDQAHTTSVFSPGQAIVSSTFPHLTLTVDQILNV